MTTGLDKGYDAHAPKLIDRLSEQHQIKAEHRHSQLLAGRRRRVRST